MNRKMSHKYRCVYCEYLSSTNAVLTHQLEHHSNKLGKVTLQSGIKGNLVCSKIQSEQSKETTSIYCCFGCKKFWGRKTMADKHLKDCMNRELHITKCKEIMKQNEGIQEEPNEGRTNEAVMKIGILEKRIKELEEELKEKEEGQIKYDILSMILIEYFDRYTREKIADTIHSDTRNETETEIDWYSELVTYHECSKFFA